MTARGVRIEVDLADVAPADRARASEAASRFILRRITSPDDPAFDAGWDLLASFFLDRGELEDRAVLRDFVARARIVYDADADGTYAFVGAWEGDRLVAVRDCYVDVDHRVGVCVVALSHTWIAPAYRRTGLAALLRSVPVALARADLAVRVGRPLPTLLGAEMEPPHAGDRDTVVRLIAYGRSGFGVLDPRRVSYCQPDLRPDGRGGIPLLAVVRPVNLPPGPVSVPIAASFARLFHATHRMHLPAARVAACEAHERAVLGQGDAPVDVLPLPTDPTELDRLAPLVRGAVVPLYPPDLRGPDPNFDAPVVEVRAILDAWGAATPAPVASRRGTLLPRG